MQLTVLGSSGTAPRRDNPASGYLVRSDAATIWMDAGPGTYMALLGETDPAELDAVLLSHMHPDHCSDLFALFHELAYIRKAAGALPVLAPDGSIQRMSGFVGGSSDLLFATFDVREPEPGEAFRFGDIRVALQAAHHSVPALAYRLESGDATLGYTGDTGPSEMLAEHFAGVDVLLAEASLQNGDPYPFHMTATQAAELATAAHAGRLLLTHIPPQFNPVLSLEEARGDFAGELSLAIPGETYMIDPWPSDPSQKEM